MKTILITLALSLTLLAMGAAQRDADEQRLEERKRQQEMAVDGEKAVADLRADLAGAWTSVIILLEYDCSCTGSSYSGFCLRRAGGAVTVEPWLTAKGMAPLGDARPITPPELKRLLSETALFYLAASLSVAPREKAGPFPSESAMEKKWFQRYLAAGASPEGNDEYRIKVRVTKPEGVKNYSDQWEREPPRDFLTWVTAFRVPPR